MNPDILVVLLLLPVVGAAAALILPELYQRSLAVVILALNAISAILLLWSSLEGQLVVYPVGGWRPPFGIVLVVDVFSALLITTTALVGVCAAVYHALQPTEATEQPLFVSLLLILFTAVNGVFLTGDLFNLYVFMELTILSSFALVALANRPVSAEVTFKYAVLSAIGSLFLLGGLALLYGALGTLNVADIARLVSAGASPAYFADAVGLIVVAFLLKGAIFPFHFWQPDAHSAAPTAVSALLSAILVKVGAYGIIRITTLIFPDAGLRGVVLALGALSMAYGASAALATPNLKRLLAYSTISNMGFILLGIGWGGPGGLAAALLFMISHALAKGGLFLTAGQITDSLHTQELAGFGGLAHRYPVGAVSFGLGAAVLAGLPPSSGFLGKLGIFSAGLAEGHTGLVALAVLASIITVGYGLRAFVRVYWGEPFDHDERGEESSPATDGVRVAVVDPVPRRDRTVTTALPGLVLVAIAVAIGVWPGPLVAAVTQAADQLASPRLYIQAVLENGQ